MSDDVLAIANLKARYCLAADTAAGDVDGAHELFRDMFTEDFVGRYDETTLCGRAAIIDYLCTAISGGSVWMVHLLSSPRIAVDSDAADGAWTVLVHSRRQDGRRMEVIGRYADRFRRTADGWRIAEVAFTRPE